MAVCYSYIYYEEIIEEYFAISNVVTSVKKRLNYAKLVNKKYWIENENYFELIFGCDI